MRKIILRGAALMLCRNTDFICHADRCGAPTTARRRVRCPVAISLDRALLLVHRAAQRGS